MSKDNPEYVPSARFDSVAALFGNHYRFVLAALPDLTFFVQNMTMPSVSSGVAARPTPFTTIPETGDHLHYDTFNVTYAVDNSFKSYFSLYYWLKGYGFPHSYEEIADFKAARQKRLANPRPLVREINKTNAVLTVLQPDDDTPVAEIHFSDVFPTALGQMTFETVGSEPAILVTQATFYYTDFDVRLTNT